MNLREQIWTVNTPKMTEVFVLKETDINHVQCRRCEILDDIQASKEDRTLHSQERAELLSDLGADLKRNLSHAGNCPNRR